MAKPVDLTTLFASVETYNDETIGVAGMLEVLHSIWAGGYFQASDVAKPINQPGDGTAE
jgi:hypothetical protein